MARVRDTPPCVFCRRYPVDGRWRPFCSERCKTQDLAQWAAQHAVVTALNFPVSYYDGLAAEYAASRDVLLGYARLPASRPRPA